jgi:hypothetical protein
MQSILDEQVKTLSELPSACSLAMNGSLTAAFQEYMRARERAHRDTTGGLHPPCFPAMFSRHAFGFSAADAYEALC